jgi:hypothetical protein
MADAGQQSGAAQDRPAAREWCVRDLNLDGSFCPGSVFMPMPAGASERLDLAGGRRIDAVEVPLAWDALELL